MLDNDAHTTALAEHRNSTGHDFNHILYCWVITRFLKDILLIIKYFISRNYDTGKIAYMITIDIEKKMHQVTTESCSENDTIKNMPGNVQPQDVYAALIAANQYGENYLSRKNK